MRIQVVSLVLALAAPVGAARAGDAIDTRVTFTFADDDVLKGPQESTTGSPSIPNATPEPNRNRLFFDDYESRDAGFENLTHMVIYAHQPGFFEGLDTEAALVLRAQVLNEKDVKLSDDGSYLKLTQKLGDVDLALTAFPISADRFRLGYSYDLSWGGSDIFKGTRAPGARVELTTPNSYAFLGAKTGVAQIKVSDKTTVEDTIYGVLGGAGIDVVDELRMEGGGGYFFRGNIDKPELQIPDGDRVKTARWEGFGGSAQVVYHIGIPIGVPIDFRLYKNDPLQRDTFFETESYDGGVSFMLQSEFSLLGQTLQDPERRASTVVQWATAGDLAARIKFGKTRVHVLAVYRDLAFILFNVPSDPSFTDFPDGIDPQPEFFFSAGIDYYVEAAHLTAGFIAGAQRPASITNVVPAGANASLSMQQQTQVFLSDTDRVLLNPGEKVKFVTAGKVTGRWDLSEVISSIGELQFSYDPNRRRLSADEGGIPVRLPEDPKIIGFNLMLRARF